MKRTMNNSVEIEASIQDINALVPTLKSSEVIAFSYNDMAKDFLDGEIDLSIWNELMKLDFADKKKNIEYKSTRAFYADDQDFAIVFTGESGSENTWAYMRREGVRRAPLSFVTRLVLYFERRKLHQLVAESKLQLAEVQAKAEVKNIDGVELLRRINDKAAKLIISGNIKKIFEFLED